jgi:hypothetical protein
MQKKQVQIAPSASTQRRFVSDHVLAEITGRCRRTWQKDRLLGRGPRWYKLHGSVVYDLDEVLRWIESQAVGGEKVIA